MTNLDQDGVAGDYEGKDQYHVLEWKIFLGRLSTHHLPIIGELSLAET